MAGINEEARIPVYINDEQAISALKNLTAEAEKWRKKMYEAMSENDMKGVESAKKGLGAVNRQMADLKKASFDVQKVLDDIGGASMRDLNKAIRQLKQEYMDVNRQTKEYAEGMRKIKLLEAERRGPNEMVQKIGLIDKMKDGAMGLLPAFSWAAIVAGAGFAFEKIINGTKTLGDKWEFAMSAMGNATGFFWKTLASGDWNNFFTNFGKAISVGYKYAEMMDRVKEATWGLTIEESDARKKELDLELQLKNKLLSKADRIKAGEERIKLEEELSGKRTKIATEEFEAALLMASDRSQLDKETLFTILKDSDSDFKAQAEHYNDLLDLQRKYIKEKQASHPLLAPRIDAKLNPVTEEIGNTPESVKQYAKQLIQFGNMTDQMIENLVNTYKKKNEAENSAVENTKKVRSLVHSLQAGLDENGLPVGGKGSAKAIRSQELADLKEAEKEKLNLIEAANNHEKVAITERHLNGLTNEAQFNAELLIQELKFLQDKMAFYKIGSKEYEEAHLQSLQKKADAESTLDDLILKAKKEFSTAEIDNLKEGSDKKRTIEETRWKEELDSLKKRLIVKNVLSTKEIEINSLINKTIEEKTKLHNKAISDINNADKETNRIADLNEEIVNAKTKQAKWEAEFKLAKEQYDQELAAAEGDKQKKLNAEKSFSEKLTNIRKEQNKTYQLLSETLVSFVSDTFSGQIDEYTSFGQSLVLVALGVLKQLIPIWTAQIVVGSLATPDSIMTGGIAGIAKFTALLAIMEGFVSLAESSVKSNINKKKENAQNSKNKSYSFGGYTGDGSEFEPAGIVHKGEYVIPKSGVNNPHLRPYLDIFELARKNKSIARLDLFPMVQLTNTKNSYANGGFVQEGLKSYERTAIIQSDPINDKLLSVLDRIDQTLNKPITAKVAGYGGEGSVASELKKMSDLAKSLKL